MADISPPDCENRLLHTWDFLRDAIEGYLEVHPLPSGVCKGCFLIYCQSLYCYLLPGSIISNEKNFLELQRIYVGISNSYHQAKEKNQALVQSIIFNFELAVHNFAFKTLFEPKEIIHKNVIALVEYQKKIWIFCSSHDLANMENPPIPCH